MRAARFAADGKTVVFQTESAISVLRPNTPEPARLSISGAELLSISQTGTLAVLLRDSPHGTGTLATEPLAGGDLRKLLDDVLEADWAPHTRTLAIASRLPSGSVRIEYPVGTALSDGGPISSLRVSPRGDRLAFVDQSRPEEATVVTLDARGQRAVLGGPWKSVRGLAWAPDGGAVIVVSGDGEKTGAVRALSLDGSQRVLLPDAGGLSLQDVAEDGTMLLVKGEEILESVP